MKQAARLTQLLISAFTGSSYAETALVNEGPSGKLSRFQHAHGFVYVRDYAERARTFASSVSRQSEIISRVCSTYLNTEVGVRLRRLTDARGWSYYSTKGWKHSEYLFAKDNVITTHGYAPCLDDAAVSRNVRVRATQCGWHRETRDALTVKLVKMVKAYLKEHGTKALPNGERALQAWKQIVSMTRTIDRATKADAKWKEEVRRRWKVGDMDEDEIEYGEFVAQQLAKDEEKAAAKVARRAAKQSKPKDVVGAAKRTQIGVTTNLDDLPVLNSHEWDEVIRRTVADPYLSMWKEMKKVGRATEAKRNRQRRNAERREQEREWRRTHPYEARQEDLRAKRLQEQRAAMRTLPRRNLGSTVVLSYLDDLEDEATVAPTATVLPRKRPNQTSSVRLQ